MATATTAPGATTTVPPGQQPEASTATGTGERPETGDLSAATDPGDAIVRPASAVADTPAERSRRRTGGVIIGGFVAVGALGAVLGLRERVRRCAAGPGDD